MQEGRDRIDEERVAQVSGLVKSVRERERESGASLGGERERATYRV